MSVNNPSDFVPRGEFNDHIKKDWRTVHGIWNAIRGLVAGGGGGGAPTTSKYILQQADASLPNAQALSALATGLVKVTIGTGALSAAAVDVDYAAAAHKARHQSGGADSFITISDDPPSGGSDGDLWFEY